MYLITVIYRPLWDGWLSWLTDSGRLNHKVVTRPASSLAQDRECSPAETSVLTIYHYATPPTFKLFTAHFDTHCQMVTPPLNCTCMMVWSGVAHSVNSCEYCVYCIGFVSLATKTECLSVSTDLFQANNCLLFLP